ncbi:APC family permease [Vulcanisaeta thermophila]|uniref:APC family permease n=1 Tax=Vulcanisaeta thermophila TaxID=867917 RepID=UPI0008531A89|nr:APC family permease [Vulcanisaeta thermophila]
MDSSTGLKRGVVTFLELVFQSISFTAPGIAALATLSGAVAFAYGSTPLAVLLAAFGVASAAYAVYEFSLKVASSGGYYRYIERGFGPRVGTWGGWLYILYAGIGATPFIYLETALTVQYGLSALGVNLPDWSWYPLGIADALLALVLPYLGIKPSVRYMLWTGMIEMAALMLGGAIIIALSPRPWDPLVFTPTYAPGGWSGVGMGLIFAFTAFAGWGSMVFLGAEAKEAHMNIRRGVITVILLLSVFFVFMSYALIIGWGPSNASTYFQYFIPGIVEAVKYGLYPMAVIWLILVINSGFTDTMAILNAVSRDIYTMSRDNALPRWFSITHPKYRTPHRALVIDTVIGLILFTVLGWTLGPLNAFLITGLWGGIATSIEHLLVNTALPLYSRKKGFFKWTHVVVPSISSVLYIFVLYATAVTTAVSLPVIIAAIFLVAWFVATAIISWVRPAKPQIEAGEEL